MLKAQTHRGYVSTIRNKYTNLTENGFDETHFDCGRSINWLWFTYSLSNVGIKIVIHARRLLWLFDVLLLLLS